jgi:hypothetical protein
MMPYDAYRLYQIDRTKSPAELQLADEQAARVASAVSRLLRALFRPGHTARRLWETSPLRATTYRDTLPFDWHFDSTRCDQATLGCASNIEANY